MIDAAGNKYYYAYDAQGSVIALLNKNGDDVDVVEKYTGACPGMLLAGGPFGTTTIHTPGQDAVWGNDDDTTPPESPKGNPYMYTARRCHGQSGLYYYRMRDYNPDIARFLQPDPIGYADSMNIYTYCRNNPINYVDPMGLYIRKNADVYYEYLGLLGTITWRNGENGNLQKMQISSVESIKHVFKQAEISGNKITFFEYVGHGWEDDNGLAIGSGLDTSDLQQREWAQLIRNAFSNDATIELESCYSARSYNGENSIAQSFKNLLPLSSVWGYTGPSKSNLFVPDFWAETHAAKFDWLSFFPGGKPFKVKSNWIKVEKTNKS